MLSFFNNTFNNSREIRSFTRNDILEIKEDLKRLKLENAEKSKVNEYIETKLHFSSTILNLYSKYIENSKTFVDIYLNALEELDINSASNYFYFKTELSDELNLITNNLQNLNSNIRNIKRLTKNFLSLDATLTQIENLVKESKKLISEIKEPSTKNKTLYYDKVYLWIEINRIKNLKFNLNDIPHDLIDWNEIKELIDFIESINDIFSKKSKKDEKERLLTFHFDEIYEFFLSKDDSRIKFYSDLMHLLYLNKIFESYQGEEFINIVERKETIQNLKNFIRPLVHQLIEDNLQDVIQELESSNLKGKNVNVVFKELKTQKISQFLPKIVDAYILSLEKKFQEKIHDVNEAGKFEEIANYYYNKIENFASKIDAIEDWVLSIENHLSPYDNVTKSLKKIFTNVSSEIYRRKNEYLTFIKTVKDEELRIQLRKYVSRKITEVNELIRVYEDKASLIIKEEFPQLKTMKEILSNYHSEIQIIKDDVFTKLDSYKSYDVDMYQIIKLWEDNFNRKKQQLTFLISLLINKLFKSFKELIDKEGILFSTITEITEQTENFEGLPLNFAISSFLAEKLTEDQLKERISEINAKINHLNNSLGLYQVELSKLEKILTSRVKLREGIVDSDVQCTVCHEHINFVRDKVITCPFCGSTYHYLCVVFWLSKYNSCPLCQNHFLEPHSDLFESQPDQ